MTEPIGTSKAALPSRLARRRTTPRYLALPVSLCLFYVLLSSACSPSSPEAVFVERTRPDGPYGAFAAGRIGVPQPGYRMRHFAVAYAWLSGHGLSLLEQQQAVAADQFASGDLPAPEASGPSIWLQARQLAQVPGGPEAVPARPNEPGTEGTALQALSPDRPVPGADYQTFPNCLDNAFHVAAATLAARVRAHGEDRAALVDWVHGQDDVFANCSGQASTMPAAASAGAPLWLQQDRAYQQAAASFYQMDYGAAQTKLQAIAADPASPWAATARLVAARALIRLATVGEPSSVPEAALAPQAAVYNPQRGLAQQQFAARLAAEQPARLSQARDALRAILADPRLADVHHSAAGLLDLVMLKLDPTTQAQVLATRLTGAARPQTPGSYRQALIDIGYYPGGQLPTPSASAATPPEPGAASLPTFTTGTGFFPWVRTMVLSDRAAQHDWTGPQFQDAAAATQQRALARAMALSAWQSAHNLPWLLAALAASSPSDAAAHMLAGAAAAVPLDSPGRIGVTYHRLRLAGATAATRAELDLLLPGYSRTQARSTTNLFLMLHQRSSPSLPAFLSDAGKLPADFATDDSEPTSPSTSTTVTIWNPARAKTETLPIDGLCHIASTEAETRLFDHDAATILNTRLPVRLLAEAAENRALPANLRYQIAQSAWTRAVLLDQPAQARRMTPLLEGCYPAWHSWLASYDAATSPEERTANGLLALMRFASTEPIVHDGAQRSEGFATYSELRENWWRPNPSPATTGSGSGTGGDSLQFFGTEPATHEELPDPPFLSPADRAEAAREVALLAAVPAAGDYFARAALAWQTQHPDDPRTPDILGFAERVVRSGERSAATAGLNHQLFVVVQTKYPKSVWASKYKTWE